MLNKLLQFSRQYRLIESGDTVICAVSGGADSMALLWAMYLVKDRMQIQLAAAHYNHGLRGEESDRDAQFVADFCDRFDIPLYLEKGQVTSGKKGLEAAARDARYSFFATLPGKIATAHTADDNAETVLMHMVRGTGLKGLGGIAPVRDQLIRPMLQITRQEVLDFLQEYHIAFINDSSNMEDGFLRNRLRHHVMPLLKEENPRLATTVSAMALRLRQDEQLLSQNIRQTDSVEDLRVMPSAVRSRALAELLERFGVREPNAEHISLVESLVFSRNPSARAYFPGQIVIARNYDRLEPIASAQDLGEIPLHCPDEIVAGDIGIICRPAGEVFFTPHCFTVQPVGQVVVRSRKPGDSMRLAGGTKKLKELFIDRKIPANHRWQIPVIADEKGILGVYGIGANLDRVSQTGITIRFEKR